MELREKIITHRDVTGVLLHFSLEQIETLIEGLSSEQRQFSTLLATTINQPHEIWHAWVADETDKGQWHKLRSYLQFLDLSQADAGVQFGVAIIQFSYRSHWELANVGLVLGTQDEAIGKLSAIRQGSPEYSIQRH